jgi:adenylate kinase
MSKAIILLGRPGSGKGTQAVALSDMLGVPIISTGAILRRECELHTSLGNAIERTMSEGKLVPDELINTTVAGWLSNAKELGGFLLDGYPRTIAQAHFLDKTLQEMGIPEPIVIHIDVPIETIVKRVTGRRECRSCNRVYNVVDRPVDVCSEDGEVLQPRTDDREDAVRERLRQYELITVPVIQHYRGGNFHTINGDDYPPIVFEAIESALGMCVW